MKYHVFNNIFFLYFFIGITFSYGQNDIRVIDNKGTTKVINKVNYGTSDTPPITLNPNAVKGDVYIKGTKGSTTPPEATFLYDGTNWVNLSGNNWKLTGNSGTDPNTNYLGTSDQKDLVLKARNNEQIRLRQDYRQVLINSAKKFRRNGIGSGPSLVIRGNDGTNEFIGFQKNSQIENQLAWHINYLNGNGLNFVQTGIRDYILFLQEGGKIGIGTGTPLAKLDINGDLIIRTITNGSIVNDNILTANSTGLVRQLPISNFLSEVSTVTPITGLSGRTIATHKNNTNATSTTEIKETITTLEQNKPTTITTITNNTTAGDVKYTQEDGIEKTIKLVSANEGNSLQVGTDGGAYYRGPRIAAAGKINSSGTIISQFNVSNVTKTSTGTFKVEFNESLSNNYVIQLSVYDDNNTTVPVISYYDNTPSGFNVLIENTFGTNVNREFMFAIIEF